jgi:hypothetical protein
LALICLIDRLQSPAGWGLNGDLDYRDAQARARLKSLISATCGVRARLKNSITATRGNHARLKNLITPMRGRVVAVSRLAKRRSRL